MKKQDLGLPISALALIACGARSGLDSPRLGANVGGVTSLDDNTAAGGFPATGGTSSLGGSKNMGGVMVTGSSKATGGNGPGGIPSAGGTASAGGSASKGGMTSTGGVQPSGGVIGGTTVTGITTNAAVSSVGIGASVYREFDNGSNPIVGLSAVTIEFWTKFTANDSTGGNMVTWWRCQGVCDPNRLAAIEINNRDCGGSFVEFILHFKSGDVFVNLDWYASVPSSTLPYLPDGIWHHVAGVYDGSQLRRYVDGTLGGSATASSTIHSDNAITTFYAIGRECSVPMTTVTPSWMSFGSQTMCATPLRSFRLSLSRLIQTPSST